MTRNFYIDEIQKIRRELSELGVKPETIIFAAKSDEDLASELEAFAEQLERRKKFLERAGSGKNLTNRR